MGLIDRKAYKPRCERQAVPLSLVFRWIVIALEGCLWPSSVMLWCCVWVYMLLVLYAVARCVCRLIKLNIKKD